jgi:TnpA family transposase
LYTPAQWQPRQAGYCQLVGKPATAADALEQGREELHTALAELENTLAGALPDDTGTVRLDEDEHLVIPPLTAEDIPAEARELKDELSALLPFAPVASLLIELDGRTKFLDCFTHAGGRKLAQSPDLKRNILAVLIALATNLGLARMSEACGISYDVLAWTMEWYVREETLREANTCIVNYHYGLELSKVFGGGTMSSSDGQRFPVRGKSLSGRDMIIHGGKVLSTYTHVSDQWSTYGTKIIVPTVREAHFALDELLGNATDLPVTEHATDTHGATLINFGLFDLAGKALTPRMRDLTRVTLVRDDIPAEIGKRYPHAGPLLAARWNEDLISDCWPDLLRMGGSLKYGQASASLIVGKWSAASRQNTMAAALKEWGCCSVRSTRRGICRIRPAGGGSRGSSTRADRCTRCAGTCAAPSRARSPGRTRASRPNRPGADRFDQRRGDVDDRVLHPGGQAAARRGPQCARRASWPASHPATPATSTSSASSTSTSRPSWPSSAADGGHCAPPSSATWDCERPGGGCRRRSGRSYHHVPGRRPRADCCGPERRRGPRAVRRRPGPAGGTRADRRSPRGRQDLPRGR